MNRNMDTFLSEVKSRKARQNRMLSLLLSLSLAVTSGVSWALHGVGLTMANEAECEIEEHVHTDECYEQILICGLEEDETHTHDAACYEEHLICGLSEHVHDASCYADLGEAPADETRSEPDDGAVVIGGIVDAEGNPVKIVTPKKALRAPGDPLATVNTIDNIAEGIKFTLFDYGGSELESQNNNYGFHMENVDGNWVVSTPYSHDNISTSGINTGRNANDDILFFAYGTPIPAGANGSTNGVEFYNYTQDGVHYYKPDNNSYSGDYQSNPAYPGNRPVSGIVSTDLGSDGYPMIAASGNSLAYLFAPDTYDEERNVDQSEYKTVYTNVNHLLQRNTQNGHLFYDSNEYYAYFNQDTKNFDIYNQTFEIINDNHHNPGDVNNIKFDSDGNPIRYSDEKDPGFMIGFFPFDPYDNTRKDPNYDGNGYNHHFGMTMEAEFTNPSKANVSDPVTFKYSGDDDMWVFVDGKLVLDIGGIHEPTGGMIDFTNGIVWTQDNGLGESLDDVRTKLEGWDIIQSDDDWNNLPMPIGINTAGTSSGDEGNKWIVRKISDFIPDWDTTAHTKNHKINMFYLERGGCYSNLAMEMNLPTLKPLTVIKNVDYQQQLVKGLFEDQEYEFQVWEWDSRNSTWVIPQDTDPDGNFYLPGSSFTLKDGERKTFEGLGQNRRFKVVEKNINPNVIESVSVNGSPITVAEGEAATGGAALSQTNKYDFTNTIIEETTPLTVKKKWAPEGTNPPPGYDTVKFRILRTDDQTGEIKQVALMVDGVKVRTFALTADEWANGKTINGLLSRYGDHTYSYTVEELNPPNRFKPSYGTDETGATVITNTDNNRTDIFVEKQWENTDDPPKIQLRLTRRRVAYQDSRPTRLTINIVDEAGNPIQSYTTRAGGFPYRGVYSGGGAEFSYTLPPGAVLCEEEEGVNPIKSPSSIAHKFHDDEGILVVEKLAEGSNTLTFKVNTSNAEDSLLLQHHSFSDPSVESAGTVQGWSVQNPEDADTNAKVSYDSSESYGKDGGSLLVSDRERANNAAVLKLDPSKYFANKTYTFSAYIYSPIEDTFKMTFFNGLGERVLDNGQVDNGYRPIGEVRVPANQWTQVTGTVQLTDAIDPYNMQLLIESIPANNDYTDFPLTQGGTWFRVDEFTAVEGQAPVTVSDTGGKVTVDTGEAGGGVVYEIAFNDTIGDWTRNNSNSVSLTNGHDYNNGLHYMTIANRDHTNEGARLSTPFLIPGHTYRFETVVQGNGQNGNSQIQLTMDTINGTESGTGTQSRYRPIGSVTINNGSHQIGTIDTEFTVPSYARQNEMYIYYETQPYAENGGDLKSFRVHGLKITDVTPGASDPGEDLPEKAGYEIVDNRYYVTDYDNYRIQMDPNSVTMQVNLDEAGYQPDDAFEKLIILPDDSDDGASWTYHWYSRPGPQSSDPHRITEDTQHFLYEYHIEEVWIDSEGNEIRKDDNDNWVSLDELYLVNYLNNDVASNSADTPIVVKNKNIWYRLPETGGFGTDAFYGAGLLLITTGLIGGYALKKRERRFR